MSRSPMLVIVAFSRVTTLVVDARPSTYQPVPYETLEGRGVPGGPFATEFIQLYADHAFGTTKYPSANALPPGPPVAPGPPLASPPSPPRREDTPLRATKAFV